MRFDRDSQLFRKFAETLSSSQILECRVVASERSDYRLCAIFIRNGEYAVSEHNHRNCRPSQSSSFMVPLSARLTINQQTYISDYLRELLDWLNNWPGGVKLNTELSTLICDSFLFLSRLWQDCARCPLLFSPAHQAEVSCR